VIAIKPHAASGDCFKGLIRNPNNATCGTHLTECFCHVFTGFLL
jgi:hypothetical protein